MLADPERIWLPRARQVPGDAGESRRPGGYRWWWASGQSLPVQGQMPGS
jgi:hypothetical protein